MKRTAIVLAGLILSASVLAQPGPGRPGGQEGGSKGQPDPQKFQEMKQKMLERIEQRIDQMQQAKACIQRAQNPEALRGCRPEGAEGMGGGRGR